MPSDRNAQTESFRARTLGRLQHRTTRGGEEWVSGDVVTTLGIVSVLAQDGYTRFDFVHGGRHYIRTFERRLTDNGIPRAASRFAFEVAHAE